MKLTREVEPELCRLPQLVAGCVTGVTDAYLLVLLAAAALEARAISRRSPPPSGELDLAVLVPAHDEEAAIAQTIESLRAQRYSPERMTIYVIADNCHDGTVRAATRAGAHVLERRDPARRGKGHAIAWAITQLQLEGSPDAVVVVDADCRASENLLAALSRRLAQGASAAQCDYVVANPEASPASALRFAGFALMATVRSLGKARLGLSCGLFGTGMALSWSSLARVSWQAFSLTEDLEHQLRLVLAGERVVFVPEARVASAMPTTLAAGESQQRRWEGGRIGLVARWAPTLIRTGLRVGDVGRLHAGLELLVPPQSLLACIHAAFLAEGLRARSRVTIGLAVCGLLAQATFVLGGLALVRAPLCVFRALLSAPVLVAHKLWLFADLLRGRAPAEWIRTERAP